MVGRRADRVFANAVVAGATYARWREIGTQMKRGTLLARSASASERSAFSASPEHRLYRTSPSAAHGRARCTLRAKALESMGAIHRH
jgi:hypothetical protein